MNIKYICTYWGSAQLPIEEFVNIAMEAGYDGIEVNIPSDKKFVSSLLSSLRNNGIGFIAQQWLPPAIENIDQYRKKINFNLQRLIELNPLFINSHTGKDFYSFDENSIIIEDCMTLTEQTGIRIIHETHRGRFSHHAYSLLPYIEKYQNIELTADFSHFCVGSESLLEDQEEIIEKIIPKCGYIHARVGFDQAAQVNHPFAPEWQPTLKRFVSWWQKIIDVAKTRGEDTFYICPEFGPTPYMPALPFTRQPVANQWDINYEMMQYLRNNLR